MREIARGLQGKVEQAQSGMEGKVAEIGTSIESKVEGLKAGKDSKMEEVKTSMESKMDEVKTGLEGKIEQVRTSTNSQLETAISNLTNMGRALESQSQAAENTTLQLLQLGAKVEDTRTGMEGKVEEVITSLQLQLQQLDAKIQHVIDIGKLFSSSRSLMVKAISWLGYQTTYVA